MQAGGGNPGEVEVARELAAAKEVVCEVCSRTFRRGRDRKRHKCLAETCKIVNEQHGSVQCQ